MLWLHKMHLQNIDNWFQFLHALHLVFYVFNAFSLNWVVITLSQALCHHSHNCALMKSWPQIYGDLNLYLTSCSTLEPAVLVWSCGLVGVLDRGLLIKHADQNIMLHSNYLGSGKQKHRIFNLQTFELQGNKGQLYIHLLLVTVMSNVYIFP